MLSQNMTVGVEDMPPPNMPLCTGIIWSRRQLKNSTWRKRLSLNAPQTDPPEATHLLLIPSQGVSSVGEDDCCPRGRD